MNEAQEQFVKWMKINQPELYQATISNMTLGASDNSNWWDSFISGAKELVPIIVGARSQKRILDVQMKRAQQGLAPLKTSQISPTVRVQAGMTPGMKQILIPALAVGAGLILFMIIKKK